MTTELRRAAHQEVEGITGVVGLFLREKQKLLRFERFCRGAVADPVFLKAQQCEEGCDHGNYNTQSTNRDLDEQRAAREAGQKWNYGGGNDLSKPQPFEPKLIRAALPILPDYLIVQALFDVLLG